MIEKYNAFISYRHSLEDNKIAKEVQTQLEHFHIPHKIRKLTGKKRIERIFRDKEELPITSDLNEDIDYALGHSDYLIVLCSTHTSESIWVQKEIETFLINHTKKEILTVLVDGEPEDVIPEILTHDTVTRTLKDGSEITNEEVIEPLSCDYRLPIKQARKEELPRIAATIIGCSYDELMRRRRQYKIRRAVIATSIVGALVIAIMGYLLWSLAKINENYHKALVAQSQTLAVQSEKALDEGDKVKAIELALQGLPSEDNPDMPVTDEAWKALSESLGTYIAPGLNSCEPDWKYEMESVIEEFYTDTNNSIIAAADTANNIRVWDAETHEVLADISYLGEPIKGFGFAGEGRLVVLTSKRMVGFDTSNMEEAWSVDVNADYGGIENCISSAVDSYTFAAKTDEGIIIADSNDGTIIKQITTDDFDAEAIIEAKISADGSMVALKCNADSDDYYIGSSVYLYNIDADSFTKIQDEFPLILASRFNKDGDYVVLSLGQQDYYSSILGVTQIMYESTAYFSKYDKDTGELLWTNETDYMSSTINSRVIMLKYKESDGSMTDVLIALYSDRCTIVNDVTGEKIADIELPAEFISCFSSGENTLLLVLKNGVYFTVKLEEGNDSYIASSYFAEDLSSVDLINVTEDGFGFVALPEKSNYLVEYGFYNYDQTFVAFDWASDALSELESCLVGDYFIVYNSDGILTGIDIESGDTEWTADFETESTYYVDFIGASQDGETLYLLDDTNTYDDTDKGAKLYAVDAATGDMELLETLNGRHNIFSSINGRYISMISYAYTEASCLFFYDTEKEDLTLYQIDISENEITGSAHSYISPDGKYVIVCFEDQVDSGSFILDIKEDDYEILDKDVYGTLVYAWNEDSSQYACGKVGIIEVFDTDGDELLTIDTEGRNPRGLMYYGDDLIVIYSIGTLVRYDSEGNVINEEDLDIGPLSETHDIKFEVGDEELIVTADYYSCIFSLDTFKNRGIVYLLNAYDPVRDLFICHGRDLDNDSATLYGYFENKDISTLIEEGNDYINSAVTNEDD